MKTTFPSMPVWFTFKEVDTFGTAEVIERCKSVFQYECTAPKLKLRDKELEPKASKFLKELHKSPLTFQCEVGEKDQKKINHRVFHCEQMVATEETYINDMKEILEYWMPAIKNAKIFSDDQVHALFAQVPIIVNAHRFFLQSIEVKPAHFGMEFGTKFLDFVAFFKVGAIFVSKFKQMDAMIKENLKNKTFESKWQEIERGLPSGSGRDFLSYYVTPVQRYPRYPLLLRDLHKATPDFHPDKRYLAEAIVAIDNVNKSIDRTSYKENKDEDLAALQVALGPSPQLIEPGRQLVAVTNVRIVRPRSMPGVLCLLNTHVLVASTARKPYTVIFWDKIENFRFVNCRPSVDCVYFIASDGKEYVVQFSDMEEKAACLGPYRTHLLELAETAAPAAMRGRMPNMGKWFDVEVPDNIPALMNHDGCVLENTAYFFGGTNASMNDSNVMVRYDFTSGQWQVFKGQPPARSSHTLTACAGGIYLCFGCQKQKALDDMWKYEFLCNMWTQIKPQGDAPLARAGHSCIAIGEKLYIFGGRGKNGKLTNDLVIYNTQDNTIARHSKMKHAPPPRAGHSCVYVERTNELAVIGGQGEKQMLGDVYVLAVDSLEWRVEPGASLTERMCHRSIVAGKWLLTFGGEMKTGKATGISVLEMETWMEHIVKEWGNKPFGLTRFGYVEIGSGKMLTYGGSDSANRTPFMSAYKFVFEEGSVGRTISKTSAAASMASLPRIPSILNEGNAPPSSQSGMLAAAKGRAHAQTVLTPPMLDDLHPSEPQPPGLKPSEMPSPLIELKPEELGLTLVALDEADRESANSKIQHLAAVQAENAALDAKLADLQRAAEEQETPVPTLGKVIDEATRTVKIVRLEANETAEKLTNSVAKEIGRTAVLAIRNQGGQEQLDDARLAVALQAVAAREMSALVIVALAS
jgi:hypothetical protein